MLISCLSYIKWINAQKYAVMIAFYLCVTVSKMKDEKTIMSQKQTMIA